MQFYQQLIRQQDIHMLLQGMFPQQQPGGMNDFTIFAPTNEAMSRLTRKNEDLNLLWKYHIVSGRYDEQMLYNMAQEKLSQANPRQMTGIRPQNYLPTTAIPFQVRQELYRTSIEHFSCNFLGILRSWFLWWIRSARQRNC